MISEIENRAFFSIEQVRELVCKEFQEVDELIKEQLDSNVPLIGEISQHLLKGGGKRLRPLIVLLVAKAFDNLDQQHISLAAVVEFLHTATLLHDDVVDNSSLRRNQQTANMIWGNAVSVLVGDFIYSRTFQILTNLKNIQVMEILAKAINAIAEGEVLQLVKRHDPNIDEAHYLQVITNKTARLFEAAAEVSTLICKRSPAEQRSIASYGKHLGIAFQMIDDALDFVGSSEELGKNIGDDLAEGKPTLPLIHAMQHASASKSKIIRESIQAGGLNHLDVVIEAIKEANSLEYVFAQASYQVEQALRSLTCLPDTPSRQGLESIAYFCIHRKN